MTKIKNSLSLVCFAFGVFLLALLVRKVGVSDVVGVFRKLGWIHLAVILVLPISWYALQTLAWWRVLQDDGHTISLWDIFLVKITGEAINTITPISIMGGDPYRIYLLQKTLSATASTASVVIDRTMHTIGIFVLLFLSLGLAWLKVPLPSQWHIALPLALLGFLILILILVTTQKKGVFTSVSGLVQRLGVQRERLTRLEEKFTEIDNQIGTFYGKSKIHFFEVLTLHFLSRILGAVEIWLIAVFLGMSITFVDSLLLASLTILINMVFVFIPGSLGVMEGGYGALFYLLKLDPIYGVAIQLVRRLRTFFWTFFGLVVILVYRPGKKLI